MAIIEVQKLQKKYGNLEVLKSIDLSIEEGESFYYRTLLVL